MVKMVDPAIRPWLGLAALLFSALMCYGAFVTHYPVLVWLCLYASLMITLFIYGIALLAKSSSSSQRQQ